jgi:hypothetical protein
MHLHCRCPPHVQYHSPHPLLQHSPTHPACAPYSPSQVQEAQLREAGGIMEDLGGAQDTILSLSSPTLTIKIDHVLPPSPPPAPPPSTHTHTQEAQLREAEGLMEDLGGAQGFARSLAARWVAALRGVAAAGADLGVALAALAEYEGSCRRVDAAGLQVAAQVGGHGHVTVCPVAVWRSLCVAEASWHALLTC